MKDTFPGPPQSELIIEEIYDASGNGNDCRGAANTSIYGSHQTYDAIIAYYQTELPKQGWVERRSKYSEYFDNGTFDS